MSLDLGKFNFTAEIDTTLDFRSLDLDTSLQFPYRIPVIVDDRSFEFEFAISNIVPIREDETAEYVQLFLKIFDSDADDELIFASLLNSFTGFQVKDLAVHFNTIDIDVSNITESEDVGTIIEAGVALIE